MPKNHFYFIILLVLVNLGEHCSHSDLSLSEKVVVTEISAIYEETTPIKASINKNNVTYSALASLYILLSPPFVVALSAALVDEGFTGVLIEDIYASISTKGIRSFRAAMHQTNQTTKTHKSAC